MSAVQKYMGALVRSFWMMVILLSATVPGMTADGSWTRPGDPFISRPAGPHAFMSNPAHVLDVPENMLWGMMDQGQIGDDMTKGLAYLEADSGMGAGALYWQHTDKQGGDRRREIGYTLARPLNPIVYFGLNVKHISDDGVGVFAGDVGLMATPGSRWRTGLVVSNILNHGDINPTHVSVGISYAMTPRVQASVSVNGPTLADTDKTEVGFAVDMHLTDTFIRLGRLTRAQTYEGYWLGTIAFRFDTVAFEAAVRLGDDARHRIALGVSYPLGF